ncbi:MAG: hypothetical protein AB7H90_10715 [Alphaproteobacteria bacterium]
MAPDRRIRLLPLPLAGLIVLGGCSSPRPADSARLTLNNPYWDRVNVQLVVTRSSDCASRGEGFIDSRELVMPRNKLEVIDVPNGANVCWRRDRNPERPEEGVWTGWTKATLFPGRSAEANL